MLGRMLRVYAAQKGLTVEMVRCPWLFPGNQRILQSAHFGFVFFEKPQPCPHNITGIPITASLHLLTYEI